jgi:hypothetical protein
MKEFGKFARGARVGGLLAGLAATGALLFAIVMYRGAVHAQDEASKAIANPVPDDWTSGADQEKMQLLSKHLRGLDVAMVETGYRYTELYWAGQDGNWDYAAYQLDKIRLVLELGIERRPKRAESARLFLTTAVPAMQKAIEKRDRVSFDAQFKIFTVACNTCHAMEKAPFMQIHLPEQRLSPVRFNTR